MMVPFMAHLDEQYSPLEAIHHGLIRLRLPPFYGDVILAPRRDNPERNILPRVFMNL
jgi:hypothetical protein